MHAHRSYHKMKGSRFLNTASRPVNNSARHSDPQRARGEAEAEATLQEEAQGSWGSPPSVPALVPGHRKPVTALLRGLLLSPSMGKTHGMDREPWQDPTQPRSAHSATCSCLWVQTEKVGGFNHNRKCRSSQL